MVTGKKQNKDTPLAMYIQLNVSNGYSILPPFLVLIVYTCIFIVFITVSIIINIDKISINNNRIPFYQINLVT